ncbi:hypothetical protein [Actinoplanes couchii]|uniref:Uncharacterized protein n=1 Tax=Actinoplanes couchii TaxID=403638 RepID=A0ABQ3XPK7_9ACTN|nr:hypothetical protein [Actinoplanes couchii]MDR6319106.1 hypothetical protein [Actinoplanes couchii]GID60447.1 hypothetical protein Aco03nite_088510 [Actinoplanes couchii]
MLETHYLEVLHALRAATPLMIAWLAVVGTFRLLRAFTDAALGITTGLVTAFVVIRFLRGYFGLQAGEETDFCGAGQGWSIRRQGELGVYPHTAHRISFEQMC